MAIDLTGSPLPQYGTDATVDTNCTQIRALPGTVVKIISASAFNLYNGVADGGTDPAAGSMLALSAAEAAQGWQTIIGAPVGAALGGDGTFGTVCISSASGTISVRVESHSPETRRGF